MNKQDFAYIGCRLLALYWAVRAIYALGSFITSFATWKSNTIEFTPELQGVIYFSLVPLVLYTTTASLLWFGARRISRFILPGNSKKNNENSPISLFQVQAVAFASVGLFILLTTLPEIGGVLYKIYLIKEMDSYTKVLFDTKVLIFELTTKLLLGILLLFGSKGLSGLLVRIREMGMR